MRTRIDRAQSSWDIGNPGPVPEAAVLAELFLSGFRRDLRLFLPGVELGPVECVDPSRNGTLTFSNWSAFRWLGPDASERDPEVVLFGTRYVLRAASGRWLSPQDRRLARAIGAVLDLRFQNLFHVGGLTRMDLYRGGSEDHYVAAFIKPEEYAPGARVPSRVALTIQNLRTAALSTYENHRVTSGALLLGAEARADRPTPEDALTYGLDLTGLKSLHRLCDGEHTLFLVDQGGRLADIVSIDRWSDRLVCPRVPCPRTYAAHARATVAGGNVCLVLSRHQEIKVFAEGTQLFAFAHGRWRMLDPERKFAAWRAVVRDFVLARTLFQAAVDLAEARRGALIVVLDEPEQAIGRLLAPHDVLDERPSESKHQPVHEGHARQALHYLGRGRDVRELDPSVLEALASIDGALVVDRDGRLVSFGAILRHEAAGRPVLAQAEGARTTAALVASTFGTVLKVSEDGVLSCYLDGAKAWDL